MTYYTRSRTVAEELLEDDEETGGFDDLASESEDNVEEISESEYEQESSDKNDDEDWEDARLINYATLSVLLAELIGGQLESFLVCWTKR